MSGPCCCHQGRQCDSDLLRPTLHHGDTSKESKSMLLENSVSYLSIGYTVVLDSTDQEVSYWYYMMSESDTNVSSQTKIRDLTQENTALQLRLIALQGEW